MFNEYFDIEELKNEKSIYILMIILVCICFMAGVILFYYIDDLVNEGIQHRKEIDRMNKLSINLYDYNIINIEEDLVELHIEHIS